MDSEEGVETVKTHMAHGDKGYLWIILLFFISLSLPIVSAADADFGLKVSPVISENQQDTNRQGFNLLMENDSVATYQIDIDNTTSSEKNIEIAVMNSSTMPAGQIDLTNSKPRLIKDSGVKLTDVTELNQKDLVLPAKSSKQIQFTIKTPKDGLDGILLGSIYFLDKNKNEPEKKNKEGMAIHNQVGYATEVMVATSTKQKKANITLDSVTPTAYSGQPALEIPLGNEEGHIIPDLAVTTKIRKAGAKSLLVEDKKTENKVAPKSIFPHQVVISKEKIKPGRYIADISATSEYGTWKWEKEFEVTSKEAKDINSQMIQEEKAPWLYYAIGGAIFLLLLVFILLVKIRKMKQVN